MPVALLYPSGAGDLQEWTVSAGAADAALSAAGGAFLFTGTMGSRVRLALDNLPGTAVSVNSVTAVGAFGVEDDGATCRHALRLAGTDSLGSSFAPLSGAYTAHLTAFSLAPDGAAWTVAKVNALQGGFDSVLLPTGNALADLWYLSVDYAEAASSDPPEPWAEVRFPETDAVEMAFPSSAEVAFPDPASPGIAFPGTAEVAFPDPSDAEIQVTPKSS